MISARPVLTVLTYASADRGAERPTVSFIMADGVETGYLGQSFFAALKFVKAELRALIGKPPGTCPARLPGSS